MMLPIYHSPCIYSGEASWSHHKKLAKHLTTEEDLAPAMVSSSMLFLLSFAVHACHNLTGASRVLYIGPPAELLTFSDATPDLVKKGQKRVLYSCSCELGGESAKLKQAQNPLEGVHLMYVLVVHQLDPPPPPASLFSEGVNTELPRL
ncbi:hypothetical protein Rs2_03007 [Raphanus sativus]|nr:hypothetical protein Rs2_03007 [Raphanus sativus]